MKFINFDVSESELYIDSSSKIIKPEHLPSYVDDVIEGYLHNGRFYVDAEHTVQIPGEKGKIYIDISVSPARSYRWAQDIDEFILIGGGGVEQVQSDWAETNSSLKSFIKNKPQHIVQSINNVSPDAAGNATVTTFMPLPDSVVRRDVTTEQFCNNISALSSCKKGVAYLGGECNLTDMPFYNAGGSSTRAEIIVYVLSDSRVMMLELSSTDSFEYGSGNSVAGKWYAMYFSGTLWMPWKGVMTCKKNAQGRYVPENDSDGVSYYFLKQSLNEKVNKTSSLQASDSSAGISVVLGGNLTSQSISIGVTSGSVSVGNASVVTGGVVYDAIQSAIVATINKPT